MSIKKVLFMVLVAGAVMLAVGIGPRFANTARALPPAQEADPPGVTIPYPGRLSDDAGQPVADGTYDFVFAIYDAPTGGEPLWSESQEGVMVEGGAFVTPLGSVEPIPAEVLGDGERWLEVGVRGPGEAEFTLLSPRQRLSAAASMSPASPAAGPPCPHDHFGETWSGSTGSFGLEINNNSNGGGTGAIDGASNTTSGSAVWGEAINTSGTAAGVTGYSYSPDGYGGHFYNDRGGVALAVEGTGSTVAKAALRLENPNADRGMAAYIHNSSNYHTAHFHNTGSGGVLFLQNNGDANGSGGGDFITAVNKDGTDQQFRFQSDGQAFADGGWQGAADYAELMTTDGDPAAYEPGDVLVISTDTDRSVVLSSTPYSTMVVGVYSERPGFVGSSHPMEVQRDGEIPVAVVGIVPCKVSAENGPISRGDLLVTSSTPGHAMRADNPPPGTILGKALEPLESGTGVILVLVTLQ